MKDLFETPESLPIEVQDVINKFNEDNEQYMELELMKSKLNALGYNFEYGLDGITYNLHKIESDDKH